MCLFCLRRLGLGVMGSVVHGWRGVPIITGRRRPLLIVSAERPQVTLRRPRISPANLEVILSGQWEGSMCKGNVPLGCLCCVCHSDKQAALLPGAISLSFSMHIKIHLEIQQQIFLSALENSTGVKEREVQEHLICSVLIKRCHRTTSDNFM